MSGYWGDPERNAEALVMRPAPGGFEEPWFRTGDHVRQDEAGNLVFAGRADLQVKVRGYRVELEEVENALLRLEPVQGRIEMARERIDARRVAQVEAVDIQSMGPVSVVGFGGVARRRIAGEPRRDDDVSTAAQQLDAGLVTDLDPGAGD